MEIEVTVIIPIYNMEKYLVECLESAISQTFKRMEILCINDGSNDNSLQIIQKYGERDTRIEIISQENKGVAFARNQGIKKAKGKYVMFMDPDDCYPEIYTIEKLYKAVEGYRVKIAGGVFSDFDSNGKCNTASDYENDMLYGYLFKKSQIMEYKDYQFDYGYHRFIYNKNFLIENDIYFPDLIRFQDPPFMVKALTLAGQFYAMTDITYCYRLNHKKIEWDERKTDSLLKGLQMNLQWAWEHNLSDLYDLTIRRIVVEYREAIKKQFVVSIKNERLLLAILGELKGDEQIRRLMWMVIEIYQQMNVNSQETLNVEKEHVHELNMSIKEMQENITLMQNDCKQKDEMLVRLTRSISYRLGLWITWVPRKIIRNVRRS